MGAVLITPLIQALMFVLGLVVLIGWVIIKDANDQINDL